jgi:hypothetical protein
MQFWLYFCNIAPMKYISLALFALLLGSCKKDDPTPPAPTPTPPPYICCPTTSPNLITPLANATITEPVTWRWNKIEGAASYILKVEGDWVGQNGTAYYANLLQVTVTDTFYVQNEFPSFPVSLNGAEGYWRVWGKGSDGTVGPEGEQRPFTIQD